VINSRSNRSDSAETDQNSQQAFSCPDPLTPSGIARTFIRGSNDLNDQETEKKIAYSAGHVPSRVLTELDYSQTTKGTDHTGNNSECIPVGSVDKYLHYIAPSHMPTNRVFKSENEEQSIQSNDRQNLDKSSPIRRNQSIDSLNNLDEAIADWDPFFSADDIPQSEARRKVDDKIISDM